MFDWDVIIIGGGPAGLTAGLYLARAKVRTLLLEEESFGGKIKNVEWIENYPGFSGGIAGAQLANEIQAQAEKYGLRTEMGQVSGLEIFSESRWVGLSDGRGYTTAAVIIAGGSRHKKLNVPGEAELEGKGVFSCAFCDGGGYADKVVAVCGGGDSGITEALYMAKIASEVILIEAMPKLTATAVLQERLANNTKIQVRLGTRVESISGQGRVEGIEISEASSGKKEVLKTDGVLVQVGMDPNTDYLPETVTLDKFKQIVVNEKMETSVPFVLAAGDIRSVSPGQVATAVGDGATAAISAIRMLQKLDFTP
jgi:thioredoxin reductase (NADPH)